MASKQTYECFACKNNGFPAVMVYLSGKDPQGRAIRLEEDGITMHTHKTKVPSQQHQQLQQAQQQGSTTVVTEPTATKILNAKLDRIISLLEQRLPLKGSIGSE